jgi:hypothetical protein
MLIFIFIVSVSYAESEAIKQWKCKDWEQINVQVEKAPLKTTQPSKPVKKEIKPLPQKIADIKPQDYNCPKEKKNLILLQPGLMFAYSRQFHQPAVIPTMGIVYMRDITPMFSMGPGINGSYAFYHRSFNAIGFTLNFGFKF